LRPLLVLLGGLVLAAVAAAPAGAATAAAQRECAPPGDRCWFIAKLVAGPGEANRLTVTRPEPATVEYRDAAAPVVAGERCVQLDEHAVRCTATFVNTDSGDGDDVVRGLGVVSLGDGDDRFEALGRRVIADGGRGADVLTGADGGDQLSGGPGRDQLAGGPGNDRLLGSGGRDVLEGGRGNDDLEASDVAAEAASDRVAGGPGRDRASWGQVDRPVVVDLADPAPDGASGEHDVLTSIESVRGTSLGDRIAGDAGGNELDGGLGGADLLLGRAGDDVLFSSTESWAVQRGGPGDDRLNATGPGRLHGGSGDDRLHAEHGAGGVPSWSCGPGRDLLTLDAYRRFALGACEAVAFDASQDSRVARLDARPAVTRRGARFRLRCERYACRGTIVLADASGRVAGRARFRRRAYSDGTLTVALPPSALAALRSRSGWPVRVRITVRGSTPKTVRFTARLRAR
jgi:hypothetical protein